MTQQPDPVSLKILWDRLLAITDEAAATLTRTSFSTLVRESNDFACVLLDREGNSLAQNQVSIPSFIGTLPITVRHFLRRFPPETLIPGDVLVTNDPWLATGHLPDVSVMLPIFRYGRLIALAASVAHVPDIGGRIRSADAREIYEEGLRIPMTKLFSGGERNELLFEIVRNNVRVPDQVVGDILAQVAANELAAKRLVSLMNEQGLDDLTDLAWTIQRQSEQAMRRAIRALPDGDYRSEATPDGFDERLRIAMQLRVAGDEIVVDYAGSSPQIAHALNTVANYTFAYTAYAIKCVVSPGIPNNEGSFRPIRVVAPEGSLLNPRYPAAVGGRALIGHFLPAAVFSALAPVIPDAVQAPSGSPLWCLTVAGQHRGTRFAGAYFLNGGQGASARQDGISALSFPSNVANTPIEVMEAQAPLVIEQKALRPDSGGPGRQRGGLGQTLGVRFTGDEPTTVALLADRLHSPAAGLLGGGDGAAGSVLLNGQPINPKRMLLVQPGDRLALNTPGGGGYGPVAERDADARAEDRRAGLVSDDGHPMDRENARFT
jgi:N-methylhydantoinase B